MKLKSLSLSVFIFINLNSFSQINFFDYPAPDNLDTLKKLDLWSTYYYIPVFDAGGKVPIIYEDGTASGLFVDIFDFCTAALQGTGYVKMPNGNIVEIHFAKRGKKSFVDCRQCEKYRNSQGAEDWGRTLWKKPAPRKIKGKNPVPYRTIAVDPRYIPFGTTIFIPKIRGQIFSMPNGEKIVHDGYFFASDKGSAIKENHIDIFTGTNPLNPFPDLIVSKRERTLDAYIVSNDNIRSSLANMHGKK